MSSTETVAQKLATYVCQLDYGRLPVHVVDRTKELLLDQLGCELLGSTVEWNQPIYRFVKENKWGGSASIVNYGDKVPLDDAVFVNGTFGQGCELDDYYDQGGGHPGAASIPVAMALAGAGGVSGKTFISSIAAGYEIGWRVGRGLLPQMMRRGFHSQSVIGVFIAAATAGKVLKLNPNQMAHAFAIAGSHACGTMEFDQSGGEVKRMHTGLACAGGIRSAMLAGMGLTGPLTIFEGERGILKVFGDDCDTESVTKGLGSDFSIMHAAIKRFPVNASQHSPIELLSQLIAENGINPEHVERIEVGLNEHVILHGGAIQKPRQVVEAQFSLRFSLALRLLKGSNDLRFYMDQELWHDPKLLELANKIYLFREEAAQGPLRFACRMRVTPSDGKVIEGYLPYPKGTGRNPLSKEEVRAKFISLGGRVLPRERLDGIIEEVEGIEAEQDLSGLVQMMIV